MSARPPPPQNPKAHDQTREQVRLWKRFTDRPDEQVKAGRVQRERRGLDEREACQLTEHGALTRAEDVVPAAQKLKQGSREQGGDVCGARIETRELDEQEKRVVSLMKEVEPLLSPEAHEKVTRLLCEVTAYDLMQALHMAGHARTKTKFRG